MPATIIKNTRASDRGTTNNDGDHLYCDVQQLEHAVEKLVLKTNIDPEALSRFNQLKSSLLNWLLTATTPSANNHQNSWPQWGWYPFVDETDIRIGLLEIHKDKPVPIHDHPGANGLLLVLGGTLRVDEYLPRPMEGLNKIKIVELVLQQRTIFDTNDYALITPNDGNIHSLIAETDICLVLDILLTPYDETQRTWYMPMTEVSQNNQSFNAFYVQAKAS